MGRAKYDGWFQFKGMARAEAESQYATLISEIDPAFKCGAWKTDIDGSEVLLH